MADTVDTFLPVVEYKPLEVLLEPQKFEQFLTQIRLETGKLVPDLGSAKGRKAIASLAYKVSRTKTAIEDVAKEATEDWRKKTAEVNAAKKLIIEKLDALRDEVRKPLTDWEQAEKEKEGAFERTLETLNKALVVELDATPEQIAERVATIEALELKEEVFGDKHAMMAMMKANVLISLQSTYSRLVQAEADRQELARLRAAEAQRQASAEAFVREVQAAEIEVAVHPLRAALAAVVEAAEDEDSSVTAITDVSGAVVAFEHVDPETGEVTELPVESGAGVSSAVSDVVTTSNIAHVPHPLAAAATKELAQLIAKELGLFYQRMQPEGGSDDLTQADFDRAARAAFRWVLTKLGRLG